MHWRPQPVGKGGATAMPSPRNFEWVRIQTTIPTYQGCGAGAGAGAAGADRFWSEPEPEPEPPKRFARSRSWSRSRQKRGGSGSEKGYNCGKKKQNESEITRNSRTNSLPKFYINNFRTRGQHRRCVWAPSRRLRRVNHFLPFKCIPVRTVTVHDIAWCLLIVLMCISSSLLLYSPGKKV